MRYLLFMFLLLLPACMGTQAQVQPALETSAALRQVFDHEQAVNLALVKASNPQPATLQAYQAEQERTRGMFMKVWNSHNSHLASIGLLTPEEVNAVLQAALPLFDR